MIHETSKKVKDYRCQVVASFSLRSMPAPAKDRRLHSAFFIPNVLCLHAPVLLALVRGILKAPDPAQEVFPPLP